MRLPKVPALQTVLRVHRPRANRLAIPPPPPVLITTTLHIRPVALPVIVIVVPRLVVHCLLIGAEHVRADHGRAVVGDIPARVVIRLLEAKLPREQGEEEVLLRAVDEEDDEADYCAM